ncbi:MAG: UDP-N-acetylmuramoyl-L-alanine--D-glutamate ligase [Lachnospiraceae bacterium]|nr:UDP-N-acetylmuramoyl-L-alanine--D-glutamate ligase [Lachnospiraceae bacterium]
MLNIKERFNDKKILIWGYGREGKSTESFLKAHCSPKSIDIFEGKRDGFDEESYDIIFKSPGIVMLEDNDRFTSQTEIFLECFRDQTVGITGTKGKSTTSAMLAKVLSDCTERNVILLGNIGLPCLDRYDDIDSDSIVVFEMSCHQLVNTKVSPHIAVLLNLYEEHLDYYGTMEAYFGAKKNITLHQHEGDRLFVGDNVPEVETAAGVTVINTEEVGEYILKIPGEHNYINAEFVYRIAQDVFGADGEDIKRSMAQFEGLPHRLQYIGENKGIRFYDDSISTIPHATIAALTALPDTDTVLIGGMDRGIDYDELISYIKTHPGVKYIFAYETGKRIYDEVSSCPECYYEEDLEAAVKLAVDLTTPGRICLLSPAAASYGYFKNFEHRGEMFKQYALKV